MLVNAGRSPRAGQVPSLACRIYLGVQMFKSIMASCVSCWVSRGGSKESESEVVGRCQVRKQRRPPRPQDWLARQLMVRLRCIYHNTTKMMQRRLPEPRRMDTDASDSRHKEVTSSQCHVRRPTEHSRGAYERSMRPPNTTLHLLCLPAIAAHTTQWVRTCTETATKQCVQAP